MKLLTAEHRKIRTTRTIWALWLATIVVIAVGSFSMASSAAATDLTGPIHEQPLFLMTSVNISLFALLVGVRSATDEFRFGTITWTFVAVKRRSWWFAVKAAVAAAYAAMITATAAVIGVVAALAVSSGKGGDLSFADSDRWPLVGLVAASTMWAVVGVSIGSIIRQQVAAVVTAIVWVLAIENLGASLLGETGKYLPGQAAHALAQAGGEADLLSAFAGGAVLLSLTAIIAAAAAATLVRRPLTPQV